MFFVVFFLQTIFRRDFNEFWNLILQNHISSSRTAWLVHGNSILRYDKHHSYASKKVLFHYRYIRYTSSSQQIYIWIQKDIYPTVVRCISYSRQIYIKINSVVMHPAITIKKQLFLWILSDYCQLYVWILYQID